ncbi:putative bifunctional diguanylate cyclase/phosphodiesterase [Pelagibacterium halotolerans]|uniref:putative bifunctional diguanylate cyclase/phosphodiesterase n=1 Tax=Pelagibacterium halotolerans TaxID=531813 RepID=UPI00384DCC59
MASTVLWSKTFAGTEERLEALDLAVEELPVGVALLHLDGRPILFNRMFRELYHIKEGELDRPLSFDEMIAEGRFTDWKEDPAAYFKRLTDTLRRGEPFSAEVEIGGRVIAVNDSPLEGKYLLTTQQDITNQVIAERRAAYLALHDPLTELPNRAAFSSELTTLLEEARVRREEFAVLAVDLDHFKDVNDVFGHATGDALLKEIGKRFSKAVGGEFLARLGGDEFTFICRGSQPHGVATLAESIYSHASGEMVINDHSLVVGLSMGAAIFPTDGDDAKTLLNRADAALYRSKSEGRGIMRFYKPEMDERIHEQRLLQQDLRVAVARNELKLHYQPQARIDGTITGYEALVRWDLPRLGMVMPDDFIPLAEKTGLIIDIGEWVLREGCREAADWPEPLHIAINLSPVQFRHGDLAGLIHEVLLDTGLRPDRLELEITESTLVDDFGRALSLLRRIKNLGVKIAMDDFGTGYSSLSYLQAFPFDKLKIDRSFVARIDQSEHAKEIIRAVIGLGRGLNLPIIAEGVETPAQLAFLTAEACHGIQGYLVGKPAPFINGVQTSPRRRKPIPAPRDRGFQST